MTATTTTPYPMRTASEKRTAYLARLGQLKAERSSWISHWSELARYILPRAPRFFASDRNRAGAHKYGSILDSTATRSLRVLSAGMMAGMTSPARPWFRLTVTDPDLALSHTVRLWLDDVRDRMQRVFSRSNVYRILQRVYEELGVFGTSAVFVATDAQSVIRCHSLPIGEFCCQQDYQGRVTTVYREFERSVVELVKEFGYDACSTAVQQAFDNRNFEAPIKVVHVVEPRADQERRIESGAAIDMPWASVYFESGGNDDKILRESGFRRMRVLVPRWQVSGADIYGVSPGMEALGDIKQLQQEQLRKSQGIDYQTKPPLQVPQSVHDRLSDTLPGGTFYYEPGAILPHDQTTPNGGVRTAFEVKLELQHLLADIEDVRVRIKRAFHEDMFLMLAMLDKRMTAKEVIERQEEKLLMVGPVIERLTNELLEPLIDIVFDDMLSVGLIPPPPDELRGADLDVEFVSILAQAQRAVGITSVQQFMNDILSAAQTQPDVVDNVNLDAWARRTANMRGVDEELLVEPQTVQELRETRAQAQAAREQLDAAATQASVVKDLSTAPVDQGTALTEAMRSLNGRPALPAQ
jgi:hypothetical protein